MRLRPPQKVAWQANRSEKTQSLLTEQKMLSGMGVGDDQGSVNTDSGAT